MFLYGASGHAKVIIDILRAGHESIERCLMIMWRLLLFLVTPVRYVPSRSRRGPGPVVRSE